MINFLRAFAIFSSIGLYNIYNKTFLTWDQGLVVFSLAFLGLTLYEIVEDYVVKQFNAD
jgi:hypothetical protein